MKKNNKVDIKKFVIISYVVLMGVLLASVVFSKIIGNKLGVYIEDTMNHSAELCAEVIERQYQNDMQMLEGLAVRISSGVENNPELAMEHLVSTVERYNMKRIAFSYPDGTTFATDHIEMQLSGVDNFERALAGEQLLTTVIDDVTDGKRVNIYSLPVYQSETNEILGVLSAVYPSETFETLFSASHFEGEGYTYIVDSQGNIVINSPHPNAIRDITNLFKYMESTQKKATISLQESLSKQGEGFIEIDCHKKDDLFSYYKKLKISDWYVFSIVPKTVAEETKIEVMASVLVYCVAISIISIFVVISVNYTIGEKTRELKKALYVDSITGGRSYEKFHMDCRQRLDKRSENKAAFVFLDIDNFNLVSTLYGHEESEDTIRRVYSMILNCVGDKGIIGRNSADQFCVMYFYNEDEEFEKSIKRFVKTLHDNAKFANMLRPTMGIYVIEDPSEGTYDMFNKARTAHESIKQNEDTVVAYYDAGFRDKKFRNKHMEDEMVEALRRHEFVPYLQPKYNALTGKICGAEALIRWITAEGKIISPGLFIPLAENNGFVRNLDKEMFQMICKLQKSLLEQGLTPVPISVNVSRHLLYDKSFAEDYCTYISQIGIPVELVELEITESALFEDINLFRSTLEKLRSFGFKILMDDFGTGYSSLMMLHTVPIDIMKLDKSFIDDYADKKGSSIIQCVLNLAKMLKIPVVAEGVETKEQYIYLKESGCDIIQGFYFSKPVPQEEFLKNITV